MFAPSFTFNLRLLFWEGHLLTMTGLKWVRLSKWFLSRAEPCPQGREPGGGGEPRRTGTVCVMDFIESSTRLESKHLHPADARGCLGQTAHRAQPQSSVPGHQPSGRAEVVPSRPGGGGPEGVGSRADPRSPLQPQPAALELRQAFLSAHAQMTPKQ